MKGKTQERMERRSRKRSSSAGSEKMERVSDRWEKMEIHCSTGQSPLQAVEPMEEGVRCSGVVP
jgi:phage shock protein A